MQVREKNEWYRQRSELLPPVVRCFGVFVAFAHLGSQFVVFQIVVAVEKHVASITASPVRPRLLVFFSVVMLLSAYNLCARV